MAAVFVIVAAGLSLVRQPGAGALDTIYAEDGTVFLADAYLRSTLDAVSAPYAGYLHLIPRLIAELVSLLPTSAAAAALAVSAALVTGLFALLVYVASGQLLPSRSARLLAAAVVVLVPVGQDEILNSIANLHWPALYALFWLLLWKPDTRSGRVIATVSILLIVLSDVMAVVFLPLALWRWLRPDGARRAGAGTDSLVTAGDSGAWQPGSGAGSTAGTGDGGARPAADGAAGLAGSRAEPAVNSLASRDRLRLGWLWAARLWSWRAVAPVLAMVAGLAAQAAAIVFGPDGRVFTPEPVMWAAWWVVRAVPPGLLGQRWFGSDVDTRWLLLAALAWVIIAVFVALALTGRARSVGMIDIPGRVGREPESTRDGMWITAKGVAVLAAVHCVAVYALPVALSGQATPRYAAAPAMLLVTALAAITLRRKAVHLAFVALCVVVWAANLRVPNERAEGPLWSDELPRACPATVPITPAGWEMAVPCRD